jgi:Family of unknown function (DUF6932)
VIPEFADGLLPPGIHRATWLEVTGRFVWTGTRLRLIQGLNLALSDLVLAGCRRAYLDGSFVTAEGYPNDYDLCWDTDGVDVSRLHPVLKDTQPPRTAQKIRYLGDILPNIRERSAGKPLLDFFQNDKLTNRPKGIVAIDLPLNKLA